MLNEVCVINERTLSATIICYIIMLLNQELKRIQYNEKKLDINRI